MSKPNYVTDLEFMQLRYRVANIEEKIRQLESGVTKELSPTTPTPPTPPIANNPIANNKPESLLADWENLISGRFSLWIGALCLFLAVASLLAITWKTPPPGNGNILYPTMANTHDQTYT